MKRIILFINNLGSGGAEHQLVYLANGLQEKGYDVTIATYGDVPDHYEYNSLVKRHKIAEGKNNIIKMLSIWKYFFTVKADWIMGFGQRDSCFILQATWFRSKKKIHIIASDRNTTIGNPSKIEWFLLNFLYRRCDYIVPNSYSQRKHITKIKPQYKAKTITITNYTDLTTYKATPLPNGRVVRIGVFGRYNKQKNCLRFVEAVRHLKSKTNISFIVEWYGNQKIKDNINPVYLAMNEKVNKYGLQDTICLKDQTKNVSNEMVRFDAICLPSLWEGFSNSVSEGICCGKPMLVSNVSDNGIMVKNGVNGFLFDPLDVNSIANAFVKYFSLSDKEKKKMSEESRKRAEELFNYEHFINSYIALIES